LAQQAYATLQQDLQQYLPDAASNSGSTAGPSSATNALPASPGALSVTA
jgi:hypothetical protein